MEQVQQTAQILNEQFIDTPKLQLMLKYDKCNPCKQKIKVTKGWKTISQQNATVTNM